MRRSLPSSEAFDPTPEEEARAERQKPVKAALCLRCKLHPRLLETKREAIDAASLRISNVLTSERAATLRRVDIEALKMAHQFLTRAGRNWYCRACFDAAIQFAEKITKGDLGK